MYESRALRVREIKFGVFWYCRYLKPSRTSRKREREMIKHCIIY